jgi:hydrogenase maturation protease
MNILVLGIGQSLRGDDASGLEAVRIWRGKYPQTAQKVRVELSEVPGLSLLDRLNSMDAAILVDALHASAAPGTLYRLGPDELASFTTDTQSGHGWGVAETLALGRSLYPALAQNRITLIGIVGAQFDLGADLSPAVQVALLDVIVLIEKEIQGLLH